MDSEEGHSILALICKWFITVNSRRPSYINLIYIMTLPHGQCYNKATKCSFLAFSISLATILTGMDPHHWYWLNQKDDLYQLGLFGGKQQKLTYGHKKAILVTLLSSLQNKRKSWLTKHKRDKKQAAQKYQSLMMFSQDASAFFCLYVSLLKIQVLGEKVGWPVLGHILTRGINERYLFPDEWCIRCMHMCIYVYLWYNCAWICMCMACTYMCIYV